MSARTCLHATVGGDRDARVFIATGERARAKPRLLCLRTTGGGVHGTRSTSAVARSQCVGLGASVDAFGALRRPSTIENGFLSTNTANSIRIMLISARESGRRARGWRSEKREASACTHTHMYAEVRRCTL